jgi:glutathionyl-hydroquinone reductase
MGKLVDGRWTDEDFETDAEGRFVRRAMRFRGAVTADGSSGFPAQAGRYHLYVAHACGWSHRTVLFRQLKGLQRAVTISFVEPHMGEHGWTLREGEDPIAGRRRLHEVYTAADPHFTGRVTVPVLWDRETATIVSNESTDIALAFDREFDELGDRRVRLFPDELRAEIDAMIAANYGSLNNGVYRAGFAKSQAAHEEAARGVFARLDELERRLAGQRYLLGDRLTAADWFLFPTLFRFDAAYHTHFKCNLRRLVDYPNLWGYTRELWQVPGVKEVCELQEVKVHYYTSHPSVHPRTYVPIGPELDFAAPHGRGGLAAR